MKILHPVRSGKAPEPQVMGGSSSGNGLATQYLCPRGDKLAQGVVSQPFTVIFLSQEITDALFFFLFPHL